MILKTAVCDVYVSCVDEHTGFREAINAAYPKSQIQHYIHQIHFSTRYVSYKDIRVLMADLKKLEIDQINIELYKLQHRFLAKMQIYLLFIQNFNTLHKKGLEKNAKI